MSDFKTKIKKDFITLVNSAVASLDTSTKVSSYSAHSLYGFMTKGAKEIINENFSKNLDQYNASRRNSAKIYSEMINSKNIIKPIFK